MESKTILLLFSCYIFNIMVLFRCVTSHQQTIVRQRVFWTHKVLHISLNFRISIKFLDIEATIKMELLKTVKQHKYIAYISFSVEFDQTFAKLWLDDWAKMWLSLSCYKLHHGPPDWNDNKIQHWQKNRCIHTFDISSEKGLFEQKFPISDFLSERKFFSWNF